MVFEKIFQKDLAVLSLHLESTFALMKAFWGFLPTFISSDFFFLLLLIIISHVWYVFIHTIFDGHVVNHPTLQLSGLHNIILFWLYVLQHF